MTSLGLFPDVSPQPIGRRTSHSEVKDYSDLSLVEQIRRSSHKRNRLALLCGAILGAFVPLATFTLAHHEVQEHPEKWVLVAGGLLFSATTVLTFGRVAFGQATKALGFTILLEGVMVWSSTAGLSLAALLLLTGINAVATGTNLALDHRRIGR